MIIQSLEARRIAPVLQHPFEIGDLDGHPRVVGSEEVGRRRDMIALQADVGDGIVAWGSIDALPEPFYSPEWTEGDWQLLRKVGGKVVGVEFNEPEGVVRALGPIIGHNMLKAAFANLYFDAKAQKEGRPLYQILGGEDPRVEVGISIPSSASAEVIEGRIAQGFQRIKVKVGPKEADYDKISWIRQHYPDIQLMIDGNSSFDHGNKDHRELLRKFGELDLLMIEQPLAHDDIRHHIELQRFFDENKIPGRVCLDESIETLDQLDQAIKGGIPIINVKIARVGGLHIARKMIETCQRAGVATWVGGMIEPTPSKAHSLAMATHPGVTLASDIAGTEVYFKEGNDPTATPMVRHGAYITAPNTTGRGWDVDKGILESITTDKMVFPAEAAK